MNGTLSDRLTQLALSMESLQPAGAQPAWAEIIGPLERPERVQWHPDLETLVGFTAPPDCHALASVGYGWARSLEGEVGGRSAHTEMGAGGEGGIGPRDEPDVGASGYEGSDGSDLGGPTGRQGSNQGEPYDNGDLSGFTGRDGCGGGGLGRSGPLLAPGERRRCRVVCLMTRSGDMAGYLRAGSTILIDEPPTVGRIPDCIRRCFGLPTPPPDEPTDGYLARMWLSNVLGESALGEGAQAGGRLSWTAVVRLHPAMQVVTQAGLTVPPAQLVRILRAASDVWSWSYLVQQAAAPGWLADLLPTGAAGWMDEGILSRWLLASVSGMDHLLDQVTPLMAPSSAKRLRTTLGQLGVLEGRHPSPSNATNT